MHLLALSVAALLAAPAPAPAPEVPAAPVGPLDTAAIVDRGVSVGGELGRVPGGDIYLGPDLWWHGYYAEHGLTFDAATGLYYTNSIAGSLAFMAEIGAGLAVPVRGFVLEPLVGLGVLTSGSNSGGYIRLGAFAWIPAGPALASLDTELLVGLGGHPTGIRELARWYPRAGKAPANPGAEGTESNLWFGVRAEVYPGIGGLQLAALVGWRVY